MRLTINGDEVSYRLESERTLGEVVRGVQGWLNASGFLVTDLSADARDLLASPETEWGPRLVEGVGELAVKASHTGDMKIEHWQIIHAWLGMLDEELAAARATPGDLPAETDVLGELLADLPQTLESFSANPFLPPGSDLAARLAGILRGATAAAIRGWAPEKKEEARAILGELRACIKARIADAANPRAAAARCGVALRELLGGLAEVSVMLQTGRDRRAMEIVIGFTNAAQALVDLLPFLPPEPERSRLVAELTPVLRELVGAFDAKDGILIGDLFEYEIAPRMERIIPLIEKGL